MSGVARKQLGQYYTPAAEASSFAGWAIRTGNERILEPSVGDGALLVAAINRSALLGGRLSAVACDVDATAINALAGQIVGDIELLEQNFFDLDPTTTRPVDVVLANPPFTRNHQIEETLRTSLRNRFAVKGPAGLWTYFVLHARLFLRPGGRMAFVVPAAATFADYARHLMEQLKAEFREVSLHELPTVPNWIGGADERGALLLCEGYQATPTNQIKGGIWSYEIGASQSHSSKLPPCCSRLAEVSMTLNTIADISIGSVTGANRIFLLSQQEVNAHNLQENDLIPAVTRARHVLGLSTSRDDLQKLAVSGQKTWLLRPQDLGSRQGPVRSRLALLNSYARRNTAWFSKRSPWWRVEAVKCDAVFTYMNDLGPRLSLVEQGITCTNTLHAVRFNNEVDDAQRATAALTIISTFGQLMGETAGRTYGGGVLKFEPKEVRQLPILPVSGKAIIALGRADIALRQGLLDNAREIADEALLPVLLGSSWATAAHEMNLVLQRKRRVRRTGRREIDRE
ncbi:N-6 DNA methylase [Mesorhizobium sp. M0496]|uniref:N-6 DNA methylase n=1 Tax=Mesorhizobium sp. M0496 TaxID=2956952 RepID=UPI00333BAE32